MLFYEKIENDKNDWLLIFKSSINDNEILNKQVETFSREYNLVLIDLPAFGVNKEFKDEFNINDIVEDINEVLKKLKIKKTHILGISLGSIIASKFCVKYPEKVNKVVLSEFMIGFSNIIISGGFSAFAKMKKLLPKKLNIKIYVKGMLSKRTDKIYRKMVLKSINNMRKTQIYSWIDLITSYFSNYVDNFNKELANLKIPKMYLVGKKDGAFVGKLKKNIEQDENNKLVIIDRSGHLCHINSDKEFTKSIISFFNDN